MAQNLSRGNSVTDAVRERRLRPLYDLLDAANYRKVLSEADKLLKKTPNFACAKVFKALAWLRLGKLEDCMQIMDQIFAETPTEESTLHTMSICYRELDLPKKVCELYENACQTDKSEEHLINLFTSYVRVLDFPNQLKVAGTLYKMYSKGIYLLWAVMSLYAKALITDEPEISQTVTLPLASKMMAKYFDENPSYSDNEIYLYIMVLFKLRNYSSAIEVLETSREKVKEWSHDRYARLETTCLMKLKDEAKLAESFEKHILNDTDDFKNYKQYIDVFGVYKTEHIIKFFTGIAYDPETKKLKSRAGILALIVLADTLMQKKADLHSIDIRQLYIDYFANYGSKPFFIRDMKNMFKYLKDSKEDIIKAEDVDELKRCTSMSLRNCLQLDSNVMCAEVLLNEEKILSDPTKVIDCVFKMVKAYKESKEQCFKAGLKYEPKDISPYEDLLVTSCVLLMKTYWYKLGFWCGYYLPEETRSLDLLGIGETHKIVENGVISSSASTSRPYEWYEGEFPMVLAMALLEYGFASSPHCYPFQLLLGKAYLYCGATVAGLDHIAKLDVKHMQVESLGYLYIPKTLVSGVFTNCKTMLYHMDAFYHSSIRELMEHVISAYRNTSWHQVLEFMGFRELMASSVQANQIKVEKRLLEYLLEGNSRDKILKIAQQEGFDIKLAYTTSFQDNRDFKVHSFMYDDWNAQEYKQLTFKDSVQKLKQRASLLSVITNFVRALANINDIDLFKQYVDQASIARDKFSECMGVQRKVVIDPVDPRCLFGAWPPTAHEYSESTLTCSLQDFMQILYITAPLCQPELSQVKMIKLYPLFSNAGRTIAETLDLYLIGWDKVQISLINLPNLNEELFLAAESLGLMLIFTDVLKGFLEKICPTSSETKGRKKKSKDTNVGVGEASWVPYYNSLAKTLGTCFTLLEAKITELELDCEDWFSEDWCEEQHEFWKYKVSEEIFDIIKLTLPIVGTRITKSYLRTYLELKANVHTKRIFAESLIIN